MTRKQNYFVQLIMTADVAILIGSYVAAYLVHSRLERCFPSMLPIYSVRTYAWIVPILIPSWIIALRYFDLYNPITYKSPRKITFAMIRSQVLATLILLSIASFFLLRSWRGVSRSLLTLFVAISFTGLLMQKLGVHLAIKYRWLLQRSTTSWKVLLVGTRADAEKYLELVREHPEWNMDVVGVVAASLDGELKSTGDGDLYSTTQQ